MLAGSRYKVDRWTIICPGLSENNKRKKSDRAHSQLAVFVKTARSVFGKKCDKQLTHIVRVTSCAYFQRVMNLRYFSPNEVVLRSPSSCSPLETVITPNELLFSSVNP